MLREDVLSTTDELLARTAAVTDQAELAGVVRVERELTAVVRVYPAEQGSVLRVQLAGLRLVAPPHGESTQSLLHGRLRVRLHTGNLSVTQRQHGALCVLPQLFWR